MTSGKSRPKNSEPLPPSEGFITAAMASLVVTWYLMIIYFAVRGL